MYVNKENILFTALIEDHVTKEDSFEWQSQLRSKMEITEEISTSYDGKDNTTPG